MQSELWSPFSIGRVALLKKKIITVLEIKQNRACFSELWWLLNIFMAKRMLVKITLNCLQYDYNTREKTGKQIF